jgi:hypothetical protein
MIQYVEIIPHGTITVIRTRYANAARDVYDALHTATGTWVSGLGSFKAALAAVGG